MIMEREQTVIDVALILEEHLDNLAARRWLKNPKALQYLLDANREWNKDHEDQPEAIMTLEESIIYYLQAAPSIIDENS